MSDLLRTAILGTAHASAAEALSGTAADELVARVPGTDRERALLLRAGAAAALRRAGVRPRAWLDPISSAPEETLARSSQRLTGMLAELLRGEHWEVLADALEGMAVAGLRVAEELLPLLLAEQDPDLRNLLLPVLGERGRWLAAQRAAWCWAASSAPSTELPADADERWATGTIAERQRLLELARRVAPERGRAWVEQSFRSDKPEQRAAWLTALHVGLSADDESFLVAALNDRSHLVRVAAARALWRLPESGVARAVRERLDALFSVGPEGELRVELPLEPFDRALDTLGIGEAPPQGVGRRQWWLAQLLSAVSPDGFALAAGASPQALLSIAARHELALTLLNGWTSSALRFGARSWFAPLWDVWSYLEEPRGWLIRDPLDQLTSRLAPAERETRMLRCLVEPRHLDLLELLPRPWPESVARAFLERIASRSPDLLELLPVAASRVPLSLVPAALTLAPAPAGAGNAFDHALDVFASVIDLRRRLAQEMMR